MRVERVLTALVLIATLAAVGLGPGVADGAVDPAAVCKDKKGKGTGTKTSDLLKAFGKNAKNPNAAKLSSDISKAQSKFTKGFVKAEAPGGCQTTDDAAVLEAKTDSFVEDVVSEIGGAPTFGVDAIKFDHAGTNTNTADGLNIRQGFGSDLAHTGNGVGAGEWIKASRNEPVLYVAEQTVTIKAKITVQPATVVSADIEATAKNGDLPNVVKKTVNFQNGVSNPEYVEFSLDADTAGEPSLPMRVRQSGGDNLL